MKTIKSTIILSLLLSSACLTNCRKETIEEVIIKPEEVIVYEYPCGKEKDFTNAGIKTTRIKTIENFETTIEKNTFDNKTFFFKVPIEGSSFSYWLNPCNFPEEFKVDGKKVIVSVKIFKMICSKSTGCPDTDYTTPSELISIRNK